MFVDTTFLIDVLHGDDDAVQFLKKVSNEMLFTSEINVYELFEGVYSSPILSIDEHTQKINLLIAQLTVLPFDRHAAIIAGMISGRLNRHGRKIGELDCLIAGVAISKGASKIVTHNKQHFDTISELTVVTY